ncbi:MAG: HpcH/HpaI aldolase family protein [Cyclobacteriaceae bacterium]
MENSLKLKLENDQTVHGCWLNSGLPLSAEIVGGSGFDWLLIDLEHGAGTESNLISQLQALNGSSSTPLVRIESFERIRVQRLLDYGIKGIMFPRINNPEEAHQAIAAMYYPPKGQRGLAKMIRATDYGDNFEGYLDFTENGLLGIIQIETAEILDHLDEIAAMEGVDVLFVGPSDLSMALGIFGQWDNPVFKDAIKSVAKAAQEAGKAAGTLLLNTDDYEFYHRLGYRFLAAGSDLTFISQGAKQMANLLNDKQSLS